MSRTKKGSKGPGYDFWSKRPYSGHGHGPYVKILTHKAERQQNNAVCIDDPIADKADDDFWEYETKELDRIYGDEQ